MTIPQLPNEIIEHILLQLIPQHIETASTRTLCNVGLTCSRLLLVARSSSVWKSHYKERWYRCDKSKERLRRNSVDGDWYKLYAIRSRMDRRANTLLDTIVSHPNTRSVAATELVHDMGYDIWDALSSIAEQDRIARASEITEGSNVGQVGNLLPSNGLTRGYWAHQILYMIARVRAVNIWRPLAGSFEAEVSFEHALAALSAFFGEDVERIFEEFDRLAQECRAYLSTFKDQSLPNTLIHICLWMRQKGFMKTDTMNYHNLMNHFPHRVLFENHLTLPMSLSYVFVCISRRLGLNAHPVGFPHKVIAIVIPDEGESIYVDIFDSATRPILVYHELVSMLESMGYNPTAPGSEEYLTPAPTGTMLLRAVGNIIQSLDRNTWSEEGLRPAHYAAHCAALLLTGDLRLVQLLFVIGSHGPLDGEIVLKQTLRPDLPQTAREELDLYLAREAEFESSRIHPKNGDRQKAVFFVGMPFTHKRYHYIGLIKDWNTQCEASEDWIRRFNVDQLVRGRSQPFYHCFTLDGHVRYVAEENIQPLMNPNVAQIRLLLKVNEDLGRWFDGIEILRSGCVRFKLSVEAHIRHPDDETLGRKFLFEQNPLADFPNFPLYL